MNKTLNKTATIGYLKAGKLRDLFREELGWDIPKTRKPEGIEVNGKIHTLSVIAEKRGVKIYQCTDVPDRSVRRAIDAKITKLSFEHMIIFTDEGNTKQIWQWVNRKSGESVKFHSHVWLTEKSPEPLIQKIMHIAFSISEEDSLTLSGTISKIKSGFDANKVTAEFYNKFQNNHDSLVREIKGLNSGDRLWYASITLSRLMFVYFIQKKGLLDGDVDYLKNRLRMVREKHGDDQFHGFYREFLLKLFHGGLATPVERRDDEIISLIGNIPYLNGGLFEPHTLEKEGNDIQVADMTFEKMFSFFDQYEWTLDARSVTHTDGSEINPDVLGHIFERFIEQKKAKGAYYTNEDVTDYITKNSVIPWLFRHVRSLTEQPFKSNGYVWRLLSENPDSYIYTEQSHGADSPIPDSIMAGVQNISKRGEWNSEAHDQIGLPNETWRETIARRRRHQTVRTKIEAGEISSIDELITYNLDIRQFAQDVIQYTECPELVFSFWKSVRKITVLDPSCGSGAFLFSALGILYDLYDACLERMDEFVQSDPGNALHVEFKDILDRVGAHPNRAYFIYKSIIITNLYGVDIMNGAVEICKLRLFLKLAAQLGGPDEIEPLPDIDFNIRAGNSLVGYASIENMNRSIAAHGLDFDDRGSLIEKAARDLADEFKEFRDRQTEVSDIAETGHKSNLSNRLRDTGEQLDLHLARDYGVNAGEDPHTCKEYENWKDEHKPFNWPIEYFEIFESGGFNIVIGNPPYLAKSEVEYAPRGLLTEKSNAVHGYFVERARDLLAPNGRMSMILPMSLVCAQRMKVVQTVLERDHCTWYSNFSWRPATLFYDVNRALTIFICAPIDDGRKSYTTGYNMWYAKNRSAVMPSISYVEAPRDRIAYWVPKFQKELEHSIMTKVLGQKLTVEEMCGDGPGIIYYRCAGGLYWKVFTNFPPSFSSGENKNESSAQKSMTIKQEYNPVSIVALLSSSTFWWWYSVTSDLRNVAPANIKPFRTSPSIFDDSALAKLGQEYIADIKKNSKMKLRNQKTKGKIQTETFEVKLSKPIIDSIDATLAKHYGFTPEELDFIQNYDIKFRTGIE